MIRRNEPVKAAQTILTKNAIKSPPVDISAIIKTFGIALRFTSLPDGVSGILYPESDTNRSIIVNESHHENRQRFTMAHELGHYVLHKDNNRIHIDRKTFSRNSISETGLDRIEIEANRFAAELLMPHDFIERTMDINEDILDVDDDIIYDLAKMFKVSTAAMSIRLQSLGYLPREF